MPIPKGKEGMAKCMHEFKHGTLHHGGSGEVVTKRTDAIAICLNASGQGRRQQAAAKGKKR